MRHWTKATPVVIFIAALVIIIFQPKSPLKDVFSSLKSATTQFVSPPQNNETAAVTAPAPASAPAQAPAENKPAKKKHSNQTSGCMDEKGRWIDCPSGNVIIKKSAAPKSGIYDGANFSLGKYAGRPVMIVFLSTTCGACRMAMPSIVRLQNKFQGTDLVIIGLYIDRNSSTVSAFQKQFNAYFLSYYNGDRAAASIGLRPNGTPNFFVFNRDHKVSDVLQGYGDDVEQVLSSDISKALK